jgi:hypothetical protein
MTKIEVDDQVYGALKKLAEPFVDSPNTVLHRLLNLDAAATPASRKGSQTESAPCQQTQPGEVRSKQFVEKVLAQEFGRDFNRRGRFVYMLESKNRQVYFQNFNAAYDNAWYRIVATARQELANSKKETFVCLTIPAAGEYYLMPFEDIKVQIKRSEWERPDLEVNIDRVRSIWRELKWDIGGYKRSLKAGNGGSATQAGDGR